MDTDKKISTGCAIIVFIAIASGIPLAIKDFPVVLAPFIAIFGILVAYGLAKTMYNATEHTTRIPVAEKDVTQIPIKAPALENKDKVEDSNYLGDAPYLNKLGLENGCTLEELYEITEYVQIYIEEENVYYTLSKPLGLSITCKAEDVPITFLANSTKEKKYTLKYISEHKEEFALYEGLDDGGLLLFNIVDDWEEL